MSIEQAVSAFDADMGNNTSTVVKGEPKRTPAEPVFENLGELEVDDDSPAFGGGDELEGLEGTKPSKESKRRKDEDEEDEDDPYANDGDEDDEEDPDEGEEDEDGDEDPLLSKKFEVTVDGEPQQVTLKEALSSYTHRKAADQRMNAVEEARKAVIDHGQNVIRMRADVDAKLAEAEEILKALIPAEPDWDKLFAEDAPKARALQKQYDNFNKQIETIRAKRTENRQAASEDETQDTLRYRNQEAIKFAKFVKWDSEKSRDKDMASMRRTALTEGFSEEEIGSIMDSRMLKVLWKASKYDRMTANKPKPVKVRQQRSDNPGAGRNRTAPKGNGRAMSNLQRTGSVQDAASVFAGILKRSQ